MVGLKTSKFLPSHSAVRFHWFIFIYGQLELCRACSISGQSSMLQSL